MSLRDGPRSYEQAPPVDFSKFAPLTPKSGDGDFVMGPPYADGPELKPKDEIPKGAVHRFTMSSIDSKMYPGISKTAPGQVVPYQRRVSVYIPSQYVPGRPAPFLVSQDSLGSRDLP